MTGSLLVLGGTGFVGPAVVAEALARGWTVTAFTRGPRPAPGDGVGGLDAERMASWDGVARVYGDRVDARTLAPLVARDWDLVIDTWR